VGRLLVVGRAAVAALDVLVVEDVVLLLHQQRRHLAGVAGVDAVVARRGRDDRVGGYFTPAFTLWYGEKVLDELPLLRVVGVAVLAHPARPGEERVVAAHVEQRHLADDGPKRSGRIVSMLPTSRPPLLPPWMPRCSGAGDLAPDEVLATAMKSS
jgi:hypothetical protein